MSGALKFSLPLGPMLTNEKKIVNFQNSKIPNVVLWGRYRREFVFLITEGFGFPYGKMVNLKCLKKC